MSENKFNLNRRRKDPAQFWQEFLAERKKITLGPKSKEMRQEARDLETLAAFTLVIKSVFNNWQERLNKIQLLVKESSQEDLIEYLKIIDMDGKNLNTDTGSFVAIAANAVILLLKRNSFSQGQLLRAFKLPKLEEEE